MAWAYQGRGTVLMKQGRMQPAIQDFNHAIEHNPTIVWAYLNRGLAQLYLGNDAAAQKDFDLCLKLKPDVKAELEDKIGLAKHLRQMNPQ
jgi:tetratricopeptide (TPR) repeat protein